MNPVIRLIPLFCLAISFTARANECAHRITFLPQTHTADENLTGQRNSEAQSYETAASQLKVARYLERFSDIPVFSEQTANVDVFWDTLPQDRRTALTSELNQIFPGGLPDSPYDLTDAQRHKLVEAGGDSIQLIRGRINALHRVLEDRQTADEIFDPIKSWFAANPAGTAYPPEIGALVYGAREKAALEQIQNYFTENPGQSEVILIYGSNHSFAFYPEQFPAACVSVPAEFQPDWRGRNRTGPEGF